ncbi:MAG: hypothetical protein Q7U47_14350, partial [Paludibacter sp.]|nr:hypothetical protein [Paludibacter sp.]
MYCLAENSVTENPSFQWFQNDVLLKTTNSETYSWQAPPSAGVYQLQCKLSENGDTVISHPIYVTIVEKLIATPLISDINFSRNMPFDLNSVISANAILNTTEVQYIWNSAAGTLTNHLTALPTWNLPGSQGIFSISLTVNNSAGTSTFTKPV